MAKQNRSSRPTLSFAQANAICQQFIPAGEHIFRYMEQLREHGFECFVPYHAFLGSFAANAEEHETHRRYLIEVAKSRLGKPWPMRMTEAERVLLYTSPFLQELREERDRMNGVPEHRLGDSYSGGEAAWRFEIDPCEKRKVYSEVNERETYDARWHAMLDEQRRLLDQEVDRHGTGLARDFTFDKHGRYAFFKAVMERDAAQLGFEYDGLKSRSDCPVFSKQMSDEWDICWAIEDPGDFFWNPMEGHFEPYLEIRSRKLSGRLTNAKSGEFLTIRYRHIIIGFGNAYWFFYDLDDLETMIKAHLCFYGVMAPIIEGGLRKALGELHA